jgi:type II secretory pathway pseudopilin PulG
MSHKKSIANHPLSASEKALSLIEIITVAAIAVILSVVGFSSLVSNRSRLTLDSTTKQITALLREAQSRSTAQEGGTIWGVRLDNNTSTPFYALFKTSYSSSSEIGHYGLPVNVKYATSSISQGSSVNITFSQISGQPSTSTSITVNLTGSGGAIISNSTITISSSGLIGF